VHGLRETYHRVINCFGCTRRYSKLTRLKWKLVSVRLDIVLILRQDRCMICSECTIGLEIILDAADGIPGDMGHVKSHFDPFGDGVSVSAR
jgi:hypothetical protein